MGAPFDRNIVIAPADGGLSCSGPFGRADDGLGFGVTGDALILGLRTTTFRGWGLGPHRGRGFAPLGALGYAWRPPAYVMRSPACAIFKP